MVRYAIGVEFGTGSGRWILVDVADGRQFAAAVSEYSHGVIDDVLSLDDRRVVLPPGWVLQDPDDYIRVLGETIPAVLSESGADPSDVIGLGVDFTACTVLPTTADGTPGS